MSNHDDVNPFARPSASSKTIHIKYKTSIIVWIFLGLLIAVITFGVMASVVIS
ncbi:hypothetical protein [Novipirellula caenicola]|uniref:Uncharacterized protein n=1 Tax=Novipirellula caenicola TaxID=1536901 RepID=A0ABP9VNQ3_9BACT